MVDDASQTSYVVLGRLLWAGPLTVLASVGAVLVVRILAVAVLRPPPSFLPLLLPPPIIDTVALVTAAVFVFGMMATMAAHPVRTFRIIAAVVLGISFIPDVLLATRHSFGGGWPEAIALMLMHIVAWLVTVKMLIGLTTVSTVADR